jgi:hypothetical protein
VGDEVIEHPVVPALCVNDEALETEAVLAGHVIGLVTSVTAAAHIRAGRLVPLLTAHVADRSGVFVYYGSRAPSRPACPGVHRPGDRPPDAEPGLCADGARAGVGGVQRARRACGSAPWRHMSFSKQRRAGAKETSR